jgi:uncharacterized protein (TIGR02611 family)
METSDSRPAPEHGVVAPLGRLAAQVGAVRARFRALPGGTLTWRIGVTFVGVAIVVIGIILLPLPGPGWLIIFAGLGVLATEYAWASNLLAFARRYVLGWTRWAMRQNLLVRMAIGLAGLLIVAGAILLSWYLYRLS